jgi:beta-mannanase
MNGFVWTSQIQDSFETSVGRQMEIVDWRQPWGDDVAVGEYRPALDTEALGRAAARGAIPLVTWELFGRRSGLDVARLTNITSGHFDAYIDSWAIGLKNYGRPIYLKFMHEMNGHWFPWSAGVNGNTAQDVINAWRYVHDRFTRAGATNVLWVWCPNQEENFGTYTFYPFSHLYPGSGYVDWFGVDGFNWGTSRPGSYWAWPNDLFRYSFQRFAALDPSRPIMIAETGSAEVGGNKATWITRLYTDLPQEFPAVRAIVYFNDDGTPRGEPDWRVTTSNAALQAFRTAIAQHPYPATP